MIGPAETDTGMWLAYGVVALWLGLVLWLTVMAAKKTLEGE